MSGKCKILVLFQFLSNIFSFQQPMYNKSQVREIPIIQRNSYPDQRSSPQPTNQSGLRGMSPQPTQRGISPQPSYQRSMSPQIGMNASAGPYHHGMQSQGVAPHGMQSQGVAPHGMQSQGVAPHGMQSQGVAPHGLQSQGVAPHGMHPQGLPYDVSTNKEALHQSNNRAHYPAQGNHAPQHMSNSGNVRNIPVSHIQKPPVLNQNFQNNSNRHEQPQVHPPPPPPETQTSPIQVPQDPVMRQIGIISAEADALKGNVQAFKGIKGDKDYRYLDEMLQRLIIKLDNIEGSNEIREARRAVIKNIQSVIDQLDSKASTI